MRSPVKKEYITQEFGANPSLYAQWGLKGHNGIDFRAFKPDGSRCYVGEKSEVFAPHSGVIRENFLDPNGYGWYIKIENDTEGSVMGHFSSQCQIPIGQSVEMGQFVAFQGSTGNSTGIHLHWGYYKKPRDRNNGYAGFINQAGLYEPYGGSMSTLHEYLGVNNDDEAIARLREHLGEKDGKCNWGAEGDEGGYLGSCRKRTGELETQVTDLQRQIDEHECPIVPETDWVANGKTETYVENDVTITINYEKKA